MNYLSLIWDYISDGFKLFGAFLSFLLGQFAILIVYFTDAWQQDRLKVFVATVAVVFITLIWRRFPEFAVRLAILALTGIVVTGWYHGLYIAATNQVGALKFNRLTIRSDATQIVLGSTMLMQVPGLSGSAEEPHLAIRQTAPGAWAIANIAARKRLLLTYEGEAADGALQSYDFDASMQFLKQHDRLGIQASRDSPKMTFGLTKEGQLSMLIGEKRHLLGIANGRIIYTIDGEPVADCEPPSALDRVYDIVYRLVPRTIDQLRVARVGGETSCLSKSGAIVGVPGLAFSSLSLMFKEGLGYAVSENSQEGAYLQRGVKRVWLYAREQPTVLHTIKGEELRLKSFVAGYTKYGLDWKPGRSDAAFSIEGVSNLQRVPGDMDKQICSPVYSSSAFLRGENFCAEAKTAGENWANSFMPKGLTEFAWFPEHVSAYDGIPLSLAILGFVATLVVARFSLAFRRSLLFTPGTHAPDLIEGFLEMLMRALFVGLGAYFAVVAVLAYYQTPKDALVPVVPVTALLAWAFAAVAVCLARGARLLDMAVFLILTALVAFGHIGQTALSLEMEETRFLRFADDASMSVMLTAAMIMITAQIPPPMIAVLMRSLTLQAVGAKKKRGVGVWIGLGLLCLAMWAVGMAAAVFIWLVHVEYTFSGVLEYTNFLIGTLVCVIGVVSCVAALRTIWSRLRSGTKADQAGVRIPQGAKGLAITIFIAWLAWILFGSETGIAGVVQPSEVMKTITVLVLAVMFTMALDPLRNSDIWGSFGNEVQTRLRFGPLFFKSLPALAVLFVVLSFTGEKALAAASSMFVFVVVLNFDSALGKWLILIGMVLGAILVAPVSRSDMSPALIIIATALIMSAVTILISLLARFSDWLLLRDEKIWKKVSNTLRPALSRGGWRDRARALLERLPLRIAFSVLRPEVLMISLPLAAGYYAFTTGAEYIGSLEGSCVSSDINERQRDLAWSDYEGCAREKLIAMMAPGLDVPLKRVISWVEFNGKPERPGKPVAVEFADTAFQVDRSRQSIANAPCVHWVEAIMGQTSAGDLLPTGLERDLVGHVGDLIRRFNSGVFCSDSSGGGSAIAIAKRIPAIQSDFVGTWLIAYFGRDGALLLLLLQFTLATLFIVSGYSVMRWHPGQSQIRPAATLAASACIGYGIMLALQWFISWTNALGVVPVMGQPSTYFSNGRSHFLFFGTPTVMFVISSLRMRAAYEKAARMRRTGAAIGVPPIPLRYHLAVVFSRVWSTIVMRKA